MREVSRREPGLYFGGQALALLGALVFITPPAIETLHGEDWSTGTFVTALIGATLAVVGKSLVSHATRRTLTRSSGGPPR